MTPYSDPATVTVADVLEALEALGCSYRRNGDGWMAQCPAHDDTNPSLSIREGGDGRPLLTCHARCERRAIWAALKLPKSALFPARNRKQSADEWEIVATYVYVDEDGRPLFRVHRTAGKHFWQERSNGKGGWIKGLGKARRVLYRLPGVIRAVEAGDPVFVVEGEKDVEAMVKAGHTATCNPMGAGKWSDEYAATLKGADVIVVADKDDPGIAHARTVARSVGSVAVRVRLAEAKVGKDVSDHLAAGHPLEELVLAELDDRKADPVESPPWRTASSVEPRKVEWLWFPRIALGKLTLVPGDPGVGKGFVVVAIAAATTALLPMPDGSVLKRGTVLWASFEDGAADTLRPRLENQKADLDKVKFLDQWPGGPNGRTRSMRPNDVPVLDEKLSKVPDARLLVIDPIGSFVGGSVDTYRDNEVRDVLQPLVDLAEHHQIAVVVIAHLNKAELLKAIYRVAGSIGFVGLARSVLAVGVDEQTGRRGLVHGKTNLGPIADPVEFRIVAPEHYEDVASLEWVGVAPDLTMERLLGSAPKKPGRDPEERDAAKAAIETLLADGPKPADYCIGFLKADLLVSDSTIQRAKKELGVIAEQQAGPSGKRGSPGWTWRLP